MGSADAGFVSDLVDIFEETVNNSLGFISRPFVVAFIEQVAEYSQGMFGLVNTPVDQAVELLVLGFHNQALK